jgi:signal transduction histidine kinase
MLAGEQMARRLVELQRKRLAENRVMDLRTRRALHDETLPTLHSAVLRLSSLPRSEPAIGDAIKALTEAHQQVANLIHTTQTHPPTTNGKRSIVKTLQEVAEAEFVHEFSSISWFIERVEVPPLDSIVEEIVLGAFRETLRNSAIHGRGEKATQPLNIVIRIQLEHDLTIVIEDDGIGINHPRATEQGGSGSGLALHSTMLAIVGGYLDVEPGDTGGTNVRISIPLVGYSG